MDIERTIPGPAATVVGDFRLVRELGSGGFGTVYEAIQRKTGITYAVKRLNKASDPERFKKEALYPARAASRSLHVLNTHSFFEDADGTFCIVTDFMRHGDLGAFVRTQGPLSVDSVLDIAIGIGRGLAAIHEDGIVHLDLKPVNVLMDRKDDQWIPKIADFGLARSAVSQVHNDGLTVAYASPEHFDTRINRTSASDMFSFGMLLYELLAGRKACGDATDLTQYFAWIKRCAPPAPPSALRPELKGREDIDALVAELLEFDVTKRTMTATAAVQALQDARQRRLRPTSPAAAGAGTPARPSAPGAPVATADPGNVPSIAAPPVVTSPASSPVPGINRTALAAAALVVLLAGGAGAWWLADDGRGSDVSEGMDRVHSGSYAEAFRLLLDPARAGQVEAQRTVGRLYAEGLGVPRDPAEARMWLDKAIDQDDAEARCVLAQLYRDAAFGADGSVDARRLYTEAAATHACGHKGLGDLLTRAAMVTATLTPRTPGAELPAGASATAGTAAGSGQPPPGSFDEGLRHYERAAAMGDATADAVVRDLQDDWLLPPLMPGAWQPVVGATRRDELARLAGEKLLDGLQPPDFRRLRQVPLEFYDETQLMELEVGRAAGVVGVVSYLRRSDGAVLLTGQAAPINRLNAAAPLRIETAQRAMAYLRFYQSGAVQGRGGGLFRLIDEPSDLAWLSAAPQELRNDVTRQLTRLRVDASPQGGWVAEGSVSYNGSLFHTTFQVSSDGRVAVQPRQVTPVLPLALERFDPDGVRLRVAAAAGAPADRASTLETPAARAF